MTGTAVIVGASSEIGGAVAAVFARRGDALELWGRDEERLDAVAQACRAMGAPTARTRAIDVRDRAAVESAVAEAQATGRIAALVWAAGVFRWGRFDETRLDDVVDVLETSLTAAAVTARLFAPALVASARSHVVLIGSVAGRQAFPSNAAHVAAKHGLRGLAEALHLDLSSRGVSVTLISAGVVDAGAGRDAPLVLAHPDGVVAVDDVARAVDFAISSGTNARVAEIVLLPAAVDD